MSTEPDLPPDDSDIDNDPTLTPEEREERKAERAAQRDAQGEAHEAKPDAEQPVAAEQTAAGVGTFTLVANTQAEINLTAPRSARTVELVHHGNVADVVYYKSGISEAAVAIAALAEDEAYPLLSGERLSINVPRVSSSSDAGVWIGLRCNGAAVVSIVSVAQGA